MLKHTFLLAYDVIHSRINNLTEAAVGGELLSTEVTDESFASVTTTVFTE